MTIARRLKSCLSNFNLFVIFSRQHNFTCIFLWTITTKLVLAFPKCGLPCSVNLIGDIKHFVQILILLSKTKFVEIWTKFYISPVILKAQKGRSHLGKIVINNFTILLLNLGLRINAANYFKDQRRPTIRLATVMFSRTPLLNNCLFFLSCLWVN